MIKLEEALTLHDRSVQQYGGSMGIRDQSGLEAALARPFATFGGEFLYTDPIEQAAAIAESIIMNHPFVDGNKRTGFSLMLGILMCARLNLASSENENYDFVVQLATGAMRFEEAVEWLKSHTERKN